MVSTDTPIILAENGMLLMSACDGLDIKCLQCIVNEWVNQANVCPLKTGLSCLRTWLVPYPTCFIRAPANVCTGLEMHTKGLVWPLKL